MIFKRFLSSIGNPIGNKRVENLISDYLNKNEIVLFMKGSPSKSLLL
jgi:hypothetical protein